MVYTNGLETARQKGECISGTRRRPRSGCSAGCIEQDGQALSPRRRSSTYGLVSEAAEQFGFLLVAHWWSELALSVAFC